MKYPSTPVIYNRERFLFKCMVYVDGCTVHFDISYQPTEGTYNLLTLKLFVILDASNVTANADSIATEEIDCTMASSSSPQYEILFIPTPTCKGYGCGC